MSFVEYINGLLANGDEAIALDKINATADPGKLYDLIQGLDPTLAGAARIATAAAARLRELASDAAALQAKLNKWAEIASADAKAIFAWNRSHQAATQAKTARDDADAKQLADADATAAEETAKALRDLAEADITEANTLRAASGLGPLKLQLPVVTSVRPLKGTTPTVKIK